MSFDTYLHFGQSCTERYTPIDELIGAMDDAVLVKTTKSFDNSPGVFLEGIEPHDNRVYHIDMYLAQCESGPAPVIAAAQGPQLKRDS
jgi:hypothetical protein